MTAIDPALLAHHPLAVELATELAVPGAEAKPSSDAAQARWRRELLPRFWALRREFFGFSECECEALREVAHRGVLGIAQLERAGSNWLRATSARACAEFAQALRAQVALEADAWFPALTNARSGDELGAAIGRLDGEPTSAIVGYHRDDEGVWVARLECGHTQHIRHKPPFRVAAWVTDEAGRRAHLGTRLNCPSCYMPRPPHCLRRYRKTKSFDDASAPAGLLRRHHTQAGVWARIIVESGYLHYVLEDEDDRRFVLRPGLVGIVAPGRPHHVRPQPGSRFHVEFCRCESP